jgi:malate dehydrogenase
MKVTVIGAGHVGATCAQYLLQLDLADVYLVDVMPGLAAGKALDLRQAAPILGYHHCVSGGQDYEPAAGSAVVVIAAGKTRQPGMSREDLLATNGRLVAQIARRVGPLAPDAVYLVVTNPVDVVAYITQRVLGLPRQRCLGMAGVLDTARFRAFVAERLGCAAADVQAMVLGGHGDSMVPIVSHATVGGVPLSDLLTAQELEETVARTRQAGAEIVSLLKTGSAFYAPGAAVAHMVAAILRDQKRLLPASVRLEGEYGLREVFVGVPIVLGRGGAERIVEMTLAAAELAALHRSAAAVQEAMAAWHRLAGDDPAAW